MLRVETKKDVLPVLSNNSMANEFCNSCKPVGPGFEATFHTFDGATPGKLVGKIIFFENGAGEFVCFDKEYYNEISNIFYEVSGEKRPPEQEKSSWPIYCKDGCPGRDLELETYIDSHLRKPGEQLKNQTTYMLGKDNALFLGCEVGEMVTSIDYGIEYKGGAEKTGEITVSESGKAYVECRLSEGYKAICEDYVKIFGDKDGIPTFAALEEGLQIGNCDPERYKVISNLVNARGIPKESLYEQVRSKKLIRSVSKDNKTN